VVAAGLVDRLSDRASTTLKALVRNPDDAQANRRFRAMLERERGHGSTGDARRTRSPRAHMT
jgi:hypothetical protein